MMGLCVTYCKKIFIYMKNRKILFLVLFALILTILYPVCHENLLEIQPLTVRASLFSIKVRVCFLNMSQKTETVDIPVTA